jgi:hypothetical protein
LIVVIDGGYPAFDPIAGKKISDFLCIGLGGSRMAVINDTRFHLNIDLGLGIMH